MYIITVKGKENDGAYSVGNEEGESILYLFDEEDDAIRFAIPVSYTHLTLPTTPYV